MAHLIGQMEFVHCVNQFFLRLFKLLIQFIIIDVQSSVILI